MKKTQRISIRLDKQTSDFLKGIAGLDEANLSEIVRYFIQNNINSITEFYQRTEKDMRIIRWWLREQAKAAIGA